MTTPVCEVTRTIADLSQALVSGRLTHPRSRHHAEELLKLLEDVSWGRGGTAHYTAMVEMAQTLVSEAPDDPSREAGQQVLAALTQHQEVFTSHIDTCICPTGECVKLAPAPCQIACPAGIDVPSYLTLIGLGRDAEAVELIREDNPFP